MLNCTTRLSLDACRVPGLVLFFICALQFQPFKMIYLDEETIGEPYMIFSKQQKQTLPAGAPVINRHIQQGANLRPKAVDASFCGARRFFAAHFPARFEAFLCYSWLLYSPDGGMPSGNRKYQTICRTLLDSRRL